jgi:hypothetical protein
MAWAKVDGIFAMDIDGFYLQILPFNLINQNEIIMDNV